MKLLNQIKVILLFFVLVSCSITQTFTENDIQIIPKPAEIKISKGVFRFTENTTFVVKDKAQKEISNTLISKFKKVMGWNLVVLDSRPKNNYIQFIEDITLENEAYTLEVNATNITITAKGYAGFLYGIESIRQLLPEAIESPTIVSNIEWAIPNLIITDKPRFKWRGLMLDVSRHFFDKAYVKEVIDGLALHKMNVLHLHLVDDQGWRMEIKQYPKLNEVGAWRVNQEDKHWNARDIMSSNEKGTYGGFFTQKELKELVAYAQSKNVEIIPEIEMPAHVTSAIAAYPELSCFEKPVAVPSGGVWPITDIYCAGKESTFQFLENVLAEVMEVFPSKYIHIGGDEATKTNWELCPHCKNRMKEEGLNDVNELQSYFIKRVEKYINQHGKKLVGWDEILEGGLAPDATVMSWRGVEGGLEAAAQGHDVVMTPGSHCYFDHYQGPQNEEPLAIGGFTPLNKVYQFDPVVESMTEEEASHVLGGQANLWSEYISTNNHSEYMIYPRLAALSEAVWSPKKLRDWNDFSNRIISLFNRYQHLGINYSKSAYLVSALTDVNLEKKSVSISLQNEFLNADIRYVLGNKSMDEKALKYTIPIELKETTIVKASLFKDNNPIGKVFSDTIVFHKAVAKKVDYITTYNDKYQGVGAFGMVNALRGTKNFHDGQWQAWLEDDMELVIDLEKETAIHNVIIGSIENQGPDIYYPLAIEVLVSLDGKNYEIVGRLDRAFVANNEATLKDFKIFFNERKARFVKVIAHNLKESPRGGSSWLFIDEILID